MPDVESQLRAYATWLARSADERVRAVDAVVPLDRPRAGPPWRRGVLIAAAAGVVALVVGLAVVVRSPAPSDPAGPTAPTTVTLAPGFEVPVSGGAVLIDGIDVYVGAPGPPMEADVEAPVPATETPLEPVDLTTLEIADDLVTQNAIDQLVVVGHLDDTIIAIHAPAQGVSNRDLRCVTIMLAADSAGWVSGCASTGPIGLSGPAGPWVAWPDLPAETALVQLFGPDGLALSQHPMGRTAAFPVASAGADDGGVRLVALGADGSELATSDRSDPTDPDGDEPATDPSMPPPEDEAIVVVAEPTEVAAGDLVELRFPDETPRGAPWYLSSWDGDQWSDPQYLLIATADGYDCADCPRWYGPDEDWEWEDIGLGGPGPDTIRIPEIAEPGRYRLCSANTGDEQYCVQLTVTTGDISPPSTLAPVEPSPPALVVDPVVIEPVAPVVVARLGWGAGDNEVGLMPCAECEFDGTRSVVELDDGSIALVDHVNRRWLIINDEDAAPVVWPDDTTYTQAVRIPEGPVVAVATVGVELSLVAFDATPSGLSESIATVALPGPAHIVGATTESVEVQIGIDEVSSILLEDLGIPSRPVDVTVTSTMLDEDTAVITRTSPTGTTVWHLPATLPPNQVVDLGDGSVGVMALAPGPAVDTFRLGDDGTAHATRLEDVVPDGWGRLAASFGGLLYTIGDESGITVARAPWPR